MLIFRFFIYLDRGSHECTRVQSTLITSRLERLSFDQLNFGGAVPRCLCLSVVWLLLGHFEDGAAVLVRLAHFKLMFDAEIFANLIRGFGVLGKDAHKDAQQASRCNLEQH